MPSEVFTLLIPNQKEIQGQESSRAPNILIPYLLQQRYTNTQYYTHTPCITKSTELSTQFSSVTQSCSTLCHRMDCSTQASLSITNPEFTQTHAHRVGDSIQPSLPLSCPSPPAPNPSQHQISSNESTLFMRWPKYWTVSFKISPSNEYSGLISFKMDCLYLLAVQGTLKSLLQHHSSKASILWHSAFFVVQLSHPYMTTGKTTALTIWNFDSKVMSLLFNMLSRLVIAYLPRCKRFLISWLQSPSAVILEPPK